MHQIKFANRIWLAIAFIATAACTAPAEQQQYRELRDLSGFTAVSVTSGIDLSIAQGAEYRVEVFSEDDNTVGVHTYIEDSTLLIRVGPGSGRFFGLFPSEYSVAVTLPELEAITARSGSDVESMTTLTGDSLAVTAFAGTDFDIDVDVNELELQISAGSDVDLSGTAAVARIEIRGGSELHAGDFTGTDVTIQSSGGSDALLTVTDRLAATTSGGSNLTYMGNPQTVEVNATGGSDINRR